MNLRGRAARAVSAVCDGGRSLNDTLSETQAGLGDSRDRAQLQDLVFGTLRWRPRLGALGALLLRRPLKRRDAEVGALLHVALYELLYGAQPDHAVLDQAVRATRQLERAWAAPLLNAALRRLQREREALLARVDEDAAGRWAHPVWLLDAWRRDWPAYWESIAEAGNRRPPMWLRVNLARTTRVVYRERLAAAGLASRPAQHAAAALVLEQPVPAAQLPGLAEGEVSVQDVSAQRIPELLQVQPSQRVLDACAAPGGKSAHLLETTTSLELVAVDIDPERLERAGENFRRLGVTGRCTVGDARHPRGWWDGAPFQRILVDAPCSASGVIRRHPDIKCLRRPEDVPAMAQRQGAILEGVWPLLAPGGMLLYATCSVLAAENEAVIDGFAGEHRDCALQPLKLEPGRARLRGWQILPGEDDGDGFYFALMEKST